MIALRPNQQTALALLGYKLWLPRAELAALRAAPPAVPATTPEAPAAIIATTTPAATAASNATILPLPGIDAHVHIARDYLFLSGEALRCNWLLPPLWSEGGRLMPFASEGERRLLLALFRASDSDEALQLFSALFALAHAAPLPIPTADSASPADIDAKPLLVCGEALHAALVQENSTFGKAEAKAYNFLHPYLAYNDPSQKNTLWRQWVEIKRNLF